MKTMNLAAIDIGSNAVRLLIKSVNADKAETPLTKILLMRVPIRLGEDAFTIGRISKEKQKNLLRLMKAYRQMMRIYQVVDYRACATSAMRDADNAAHLTKVIRACTGIHIDIINGEEEAALIYGNHIEQLKRSGLNYLYVDVGGGSTELNFLKGGELVFSHSYDIGTVRMLSGTVHDQERAKLNADLQEIARILRGQKVSIVGSGGNINRLYRLSEIKDRSQNFLPVKQLIEVYDILASLSSADISRIYNLRPDRADVIVPAGSIFVEIARAIRADGIIVPTVGLADGIIGNLYAAYKRRK